jgi:hypothetical protein
VFDETNKIDYHASLPYREKSVNRSSQNGSETQHQIVSDSHPYNDHKSVYIYNPFLNNFD